MYFQNILQILIIWFFSKGLKVVGILIIAYFAVYLGETFIRRLIKPLAKEGSKVKGVVDRQILRQRERTLEGVFISVLSVVVWSIAILTILPEFGVNTTPLLAGSGIVGLAIGMGSNSLVRDYISGLFILLEDQYRVGEEISVVGVKGKVKSLNLRRTVLEDSKGAIHYIPNGQINQVSNFSRTKEN